MIISDLLIPFNPSLTVAGLENILLRHDSFYELLVSELRHLSEEAEQICRLLSEIEESRLFLSPKAVKSEGHCANESICRAAEELKAALKDDLNEIAGRIHLLQQIYQQVHRVTICVMKLPEPFNSVICKYYFKNKKRAAIAEELHYSEKTISRMKNEALDCIIKAYSSDLGDEEILNTGLIFDL